MATIEGDVLGIMSDLQRRTEQYRRPARTLAMSTTSEIDQIRKTLVAERGLRNDLERQVVKLKADNARLVAALGDMQLRVFAPAAKVPTIQQVQEAFIIALAAENYAVDGAPYAYAHLSTPNRHHRFARPRQICMWLCRALTKQSLPVIGRYHGNRDHTTVMHAEQQVKNGTAFSSPMLRRAADRVLIQFGAESST